MRVLGQEAAEGAGCNRVMWRRRLWVAAMIWSFASALAGGALAAPSITDVRVGLHGDLTRVVLDKTGRTDFSIFTLSGPDRVVIDMPPVRWLPAERTLAVGRAGVVRVRFGQFRPDTSRIVLDLDRPLALYRTTTLPSRGRDGSAMRLVLDFVPVSSSVFQAAATPPEPKEEGRSAAPEPAPEPRPRPPVNAQPHAIVLDPGHGGRDPGAISAGGVQEKAVALAFARELRGALERTGRYRVVMTRDGDSHVGLYRRVDIARDAGADVFLSLHVDHLADSRVRGASVYILSEEASDAESAALAARENMAGAVAGIDLSEGYDEAVTQVLIAMVQKRTSDCSAALATQLVSELGRVAPLVRGSRRSADFRVLKAPDIPSVLIELGFLSNDRDVGRLHSESHRAALADAIVRALDSYFLEPC